MHTQQSTVMVCIASGQTMPNLIPIVIKKPKKVVILTTNEMNGMADRLESCIAKINPKCKVEILRDMPDSLLNSILDYGKQTLEHLKAHYPEDAITLNSTGGNKLMFIGLINATQEIYDDIIYVDTAHSRIEFLPKDNQQKQPELMPSVLKVRQYLNAQGFDVKSILSESPSAIYGINKRSEVTMILAKNAVEFDTYGLIAELNKKMNGVLEYDAKNDCNKLIKHETTLSFKCPHGKDVSKFNEILSKWKALLAHGQRLNIFTWDDAQSTLGWSDVRTAEYLSGIWLEEYVYLVANSIGLTDLAISVKAKNKANNSNAKGNEYDVLMMHNNRMLVIECKTVNFKSTFQQNEGEKSNRTKANDIAYKFSSLSDKLIGLFGESWLVSSSPANVIQDKAKDLGFRVIDPGQLAKIGEFIAKWANLPAPAPIQEINIAKEPPQGALQEALTKLQLVKAS